ncbi:hypothetical protein ACYSNM_10475 [Myroides sp. LJL116]
MKKISFLLLSLVLLSSCNRKQLELTRASYTTTEFVDNHSPVYFEMDQEGKMVVNQDNRIANTNYIVSVQRDLNLLEVAQEVMKIKQRKYDEKSNMHSDQLEVFYSYADTLNKRLAFLPSKEVDFGFEGPSSLENLVFVKNKDTVLIQGYSFSYGDWIDHLPQSDSLQLGFAKDLDFETYLQTRILLNQQQKQGQFNPVDLVY